MLWKKAFVVLLSLNLLVIVGLTALWGSLPKVSQSSSPGVTAGASNQQPATVQLAVGQNAINAYLQYALSQQKDVKNVLSSAQIQFGNAWTVNAGFKLSDRVVPFDMVFTPTVQNGNLQLALQSANMGQLPIPTAALVFVFRRLPWPNWITVDPSTDALDLNFTKRPQNPYGVSIVGYSPQTRLLTLKVSILPKDLPKPKA